MKREIEIPEYMEARKRPIRFFAKPDAMSALEYLCDCVLYGGCGLSAYGSLLFRSISGWSRRQSITLLLALLLGSVLGSCFLWFRYYRRVWSSVLTVILALGAYFVATYLDSFRQLIGICALAAALLAVVYTVLVLRQPIRRKEYRRVILYRRLYRCFCTAASITGASMLFCMLLVGGEGVFGHGSANFQESSIKAQKAGTTLSHAELMQEQMSSLLLLQDGVWEKQSLRTKLNVMQTAANIEVQYLGIPVELRVGASNKLEDDAAGFYDDDEKSISLVLKYLEQGGGWENLFVLCHEVYHCYEYRLVDIYEQADASYAQMTFFERTRQYQKEFQAYVSCEEDLEAYKQQAVEQDADRHAEVVLDEYQTEVQEYLQKDLEAYQKEKKASDGR